mgnify:CR=1 FL=1
MEAMIDKVRLSYKEKNAIAKMKGKTGTTEHRKGRRDLFPRQTKLEGSKLRKWESL